MKSLASYIKGGLSIIDCHVHLFGRHGILQYKKPANSAIVMVENSIKYKDEPLYDYFMEFHKSISSKYKLIGVGKDVEETNKILTNFWCAGIGEIKAYKHYRDSEGVEHEHYDTSILEEAVLWNLPVFLHWDLDGKHDGELLAFLRNNPKTKFVLCHCGMNEADDKDKAFATAVKFQNECTNLWFSISWVALDYFNEKPNQLSFIPIPDHTIVGTDFSGDMELENVDFDDRYDKFRRIYNRVDVPVAINNLFR